MTIHKSEKTPEFNIPLGAQVVSTAENDEGGKQQKKQHYALVCQSNEPLIPDNSSERILNSSFLETFPGRANPVSNSSVRVVHKLQNQKYKPAEYTILLTVQLVPPYIVTMNDPKILTNVRMDPETGKYPV